jgi:hypothetical protein
MSEPTITQADREAAADFFAVGRSWTPSQLIWAFAAHREAGKLAGRIEMQEAAAQIAKDAFYATGTGWTPHAIAMHIEALDPATIAKEAE